MGLRHVCCPYPDNSSLTLSLVFYTALVGWLTLPNWRGYVFACGFPYAVLFVGRLFWRWESPRFLLAQQRPREAQQVLISMAIANGTSLPIGDLAPLLAGPAGSGAMRPTWTTRTLLSTLTVSAIFFFQTFAYYGLTIWMRNFAAMRNIPNLDLIHTFLIIGLSELPGLALTTLLLERIGRRTTLMINFVGAASCSALLLTARSQAGFLAVFSASYFFIVGCWAAIYISTPEMLPTTCRSTSFAIAGAFGKVGGMISPLVLGYMLEAQVNPTLIVATVSGGFFLAAITGALLMVETRGKNLADN